jgi:HAE1 family hydrophobic/amphiphilic exporter-1
VTSGLQITRPQILVYIDRDQAYALGVSAQDRERVLRRLRAAPGLDYLHAHERVLGRVELEPQYQLDPAAVSALYVHSTSGQLVPLSAVVKLTPTVDPLQVAHLGQSPSVTISLNLVPGV